MTILLPPKVVGYASGSPEYALFGSGRAVPTGIESQFEYNGIILNDRSTIDKYVVRQVTGFADADVRDSREPNPGSHGETPLESWYGGRTIILSGRIEAYTLEKLRDMQEAFRTAFVSLVDKPLRVRTASMERDFTIICRKSSSMDGNEQQTDWNFFRDFQVTLRAGRPEFLSFVSVARTIYPNRVVNPSFETNTVGWSSLGSGATTLARQTSWSTHGNAALRYTGAISGSTPGTIGMKTNVAVHPMPVAPGRVYTAVVDVNILDSVSGGISAQFVWYNAAMAVLELSATGTPRSSTGVGSLVVSESAPPNAAFAEVRFGGLSSGGDVLDFYADNVWVVEGQPILPEGPGMIVTPNVGNFAAEPKFVAHGRLDSLVLTSLANDEFFKLSSEVADGERITYDARTPSLRDQLDANRFSMLTDDSLGPVLEKGDNPIALDVETTALTVDARVEVFYHHTWM